MEKPKRDDCCDLAMVVVFSCVLENADVVGMKWERRGGGGFLGINNSLGSPDFIRTQLHAKSVICSNRRRLPIGSLSTSVSDTLSLFQPQPKII
jgi:hypothetical protein